MNLYHEKKIYENANTLVIDKYTDPQFYILSIFYFNDSTLTINMEQGGQYKIKELGTNDIFKAKIVLLNKITDKTYIYENIYSEMLVVNYDIINIKLVKTNDSYHFINCL